MKRNMRVIGLVSGACIAATLLLAACGSGGSDTTGAGTNPPGVSYGSISGTAVKGSVSGATVVAYAINDGSLGSQIASGNTDSQGNFNLSIGNYTGPVMLQMHGGTYTDEATGSSMPMMPGDVLTTVLPTVAAGATISSIQLTPLTSMAQMIAQHLTGGMTDANISLANTAVGNYFMVSDILHMHPMNPLVPGAGNSASQDEMNYGLGLAAMSQFAKDQGMTSSSAIVTSMMDDAADGVMDGRMFGSSVMMGGKSIAISTTAGTSGLALAMTEFLASAQNRSGVAGSSMQTLINQLNATNGQLLGTGGGTSTVDGAISGGVFNGPMTQAMVTVYALNNGVRGAQLASMATDAQGVFAMSLGGYSGPVMFEVNGGTYADEATGTMMTMASGDVMTFAIPTINSNSNISGIWITPLTSMAQARAQAMGGGMIDANITAANTAVGNYFAVGDILHTQPMNPMLTGSGSTASQDQRDCGFVIAAMSQYAKDLGMPVSSAFVTAMMSDASDDIMNGEAGSVQISMGGMMGSGSMMQPDAGTTGLATAMTDFLSSSMNLSGLTAADMNVLIQKLASSNGQL